ELHHSVLRHHELESVVICKQAWKAQGIAYQHTVFRICGWNFRPGRFKQPLSQWRERRNVLHIELDAIIAPYAGKVMRIECMALYLIGFVRIRQLLVVRAART